MSTTQTKQTGTTTDAAQLAHHKILERQRRNAHRALLKRRRRKSNQ